MTAARACESCRTKTGSEPVRSKPQPAPAVAAPFNPLWRQLATRVQTKLDIGAPDDPYEREADRVAERVMRMPDSTLPGRCAVCSAGGATCPDCRKKAGIQRKPADGSGTTTPALGAVSTTRESSPTLVSLSPGSASPAPAMTAPASVGHVIAAPGRSLAPPLRQEMEQRFGVDFDQVRVHTDHAATLSARDIDAHAYTVGHHIVFAAGRFAPNTTQGRRLLAHELTHVVQQRNGLARQVQRQPAGCQALLATPQIAGAVKGRVVHDLILANFMGWVPGARMVTIPGASAGPLRTQGLCGEDSTVIKPQTGRTAPGVGRGAARLGVGEPDLARQSLGGILEVAEIKPASFVCLVDGMEQLDRYIEHGNATDPLQQRWRDFEGIRGVIPMMPGTYLPPPLFVGGCPVLTAWCGPGLMVYNIECPILPPLPLTQPQEQEQYQEAPARDRSTLRLPSGDLWNLVYGIIAAIGVLAILGTVAGKIGALLGMFLRALGFALGLLAGTAAASAGISGKKPGGAPLPASPGAPSVRGRTGGPPIAAPKGTPAGAGRTTVPSRTTRPGPGPATDDVSTSRRKVQIDLIEGLNLSSVRVGQIFPLMLTDMKGRHDVSIVQVTGVSQTGGQTTVDFVALEERADGAPGDAKPVVLMGNAYTVTHPYGGLGPPRLIGLVTKMGPDPSWMWSYLENLAKKLEAAGKTTEANGVREEIRRQKKRYEKAIRP